jgi:shikimate kinase
MLQGAPLRTRIEELMALRSSTYESTAHLVIDTDGRTVEEIATALLHRGA